MERCRAKADKDSGITKGPSLYAEEQGRPSYILKLLLSAIAVPAVPAETAEALPDLRRPGCRQN